VPRCPRLVYLRPRQALDLINRCDVAVTARLEPVEPRVTVLFASPYFQREVRHEDQQEQPYSYPDSGGEVHFQVSSAGSVQA
jgi:hypothetical protein